MRRSRADKAVTHSQILAVAAKRFRERGLAGIGVADVMKEAGSSVGGFYKHFGSRDDLVVEALAEAFKDLDASEGKAADLPTYFQDFLLSNAHRDRPATGCAVTSFVGDVRHAGVGIKTVYTQRVRHTLGYYESGLKGGDQQSRRARAILLLCAGIGGVSLARAVNDKALSNEILKALREEFSTLTRRQPPRRSSVKA